MSKGLGRIEQRILRYFIEIAKRKTASIWTLCAIAYGSLYFRSPDWRLDRKQEVAVRRALKRLKLKGYPLHFMQLRRKFPGRPLIVLWKGNNRYWRAQLRKGELGIS